MESRTPSSESPRKTILVVDTDPQSLRIVDVSLRRAGFDVQAATDGIVAASVLERTPPPDLVISDLDLPGLDGFELCRRAKSPQRNASVPFIVLSRPSTTNKVRAFELGADDFLSKPVLVKEIVARASALLQRHERERLSSSETADDHVAGSLNDLSTIDLLQTIATNGKSGVLHLRSATGANGEVYFRKGAVVDAEVGRLSGSDAVYRLLAWTDGHFEIEWRHIRRRDTVALAAPALLMEGMRRLDEWTRLTQQLPPLETIFEVDYRLLAERLADIPDEVNGILRLFDSVRTAMQVIDDCGLSDLDALTIIGKLNSEGLIRNIEGQAGEAAEAGPDLEGWLSDSADARPPVATRTNSAPADGRSRRVSDQAPAAAARPARAAEEPPPERPTSAKSLRERVAEHRDQDRPLSPGGHAGHAEVRPEEPAVVIPFPTSSSAPTPLRPALSSSSGRPAAAVAGEISDGVSTSAPGAAASTAPTPGAAAPPPAAPPPPAVSHAAPPHAAPPPHTTPAPLPPSAPAPYVAVPRFTDPGLGPGISIPPPPAPAPPPPAAASEPRPAEPRAEPAHHPSAPAHHAPATSARRDSSSRVAELPFSDSASRWMTEGDEIHTGRSTKSEALDELALPSRFRGLGLVVAVAVVLVGGSATLFAVRHFRDRPAEIVAVTSTPPLTVVPAPPPLPSLPSPAPAPPPVDELAPTPDKIPTAAANTKPAAAAAAPVAGDAPAAPSADFPQLLATCQTAFNAGRMKEATTACTTAMQANPESAKAVALLAHAEFNRSHYKDALSWAEKAIKLDSKTADAYVIIGGVQQDAGRTAQAKVAYRKYLELAPKGQYAPDLRAIVDSL